MMRARIYQRAKTAMQSGQAGQDDWVLAYEPTERERNDFLMGWWGSGDMRGQVRLRFNNRDEAVAFATSNNIPYDLEMPPVRRSRPKSYSDNFRYGRSDSWTH